MVPLSPPLVFAEPCLPVSAGGNAGLATAYAARKLGIPATIVVPGNTSEAMSQQLKEHGAEVEVFGKVPGNVG